MTTRIVICSVAVARASSMMERAATLKSDRAFITEVGRIPSPVSRRRTHRTSSLQSVVDEDGNSIRGAERIDAETAASDVFRIIDKFGEKQQHSKNIRSLIQKAAQKTILVVRTKNATQAAENVTIRFNKNHVTDVPRSVALSDVCLKVLSNLKFSSNRKRFLFYEVFEGAPELDSLLKDMFWYLTAHCFQSGRHTQLEEKFYQRIADNFTTLFIRVQVQPPSRDSGFFDMLPDVLAQILFTALYEGFPKSRKSMLTADLRRKILQICYCWILGFVPADLDWSHWIQVDQESPRRLAALADFPAMRNRMLRVERIERTKLEVKNRHTSILAAEDIEHEREDNVDDDFHPDQLEKLPAISTSSPAPAILETHERCVYQMRNSPLVDAFLKRHKLEANASHLKVQLRLTSSKHFDLDNQEALHATTLPRERRRRLVSSKSYAEALEKIEGFGDSVRMTYASEKKKVRDRDAAERRHLVQEQKELETKFSELRQHSAKMHEYSNQIVRKGRMEALASAFSATTNPSASRSTPRAAHTTPGPVHVPRPPPPRSARKG